MAGERNLLYVSTDLEDADGKLSREWADACDNWVDARRESCEDQIMMPLLFSSQAYMEQIEAVLRAISEFDMSF